MARLTKFLERSSFVKEEFPDIASNRGRALSSPSKLLRVVWRKRWGGEKSKPYTQSKTMQNMKLCGLYAAQQGPIFVFFTHGLRAGAQRM